MIEIRTERKEDFEAIQRVNDRAFGQPAEGLIVKKIRLQCPEIISLIAVSGSHIVGHIFFSPVTIETKASPIIGMGLAPMAVLPGFQNQGIGTKLAGEGLKKIKEMNYPFVIVLGHDTYYPRFGFQPASLFGLQCQWQGVPDDAFMAIVYNSLKMKNIAGIARYRDEFNAAM